MQKLIFRNGNGVELDLTSGDFGIVEWKGFSEADLNIQTQQVPFNDGSVFLDGLIQDRVIDITLAINDEKNLEKRYTLRRQIIALMNPKLGLGELIYENDIFKRKINCLPKLPLFPTKNFNDSGTLKASLSFHCPSPYWEDVEETVVDFDIIKQPTIENIGDIDTSINIELSGINCKEPSIINTRTGEKITYNDKLDELLLINTNFGNKSAKIETKNWEHKTIPHITYLGRKDDNELFYNEVSLTPLYLYKLDNYKFKEIYNLSNLFQEDLPEDCVLNSYKINLIKNEFVVLAEYTGVRKIRIYKSSDLINWEKTSEWSITAYVNYSKIYYIEETGIYYFYNEEGNRIFISEDLINWSSTLVSNSSDYTINTRIPPLNYYNDKYFVINNDGDIFVSEDLNVWELLIENAIPHRNLYLILTNIEIFSDKVVICSQESSIAGCLKSSDLLTWVNLLPDNLSASGFTYNSFTKEWFFSKSFGEIIYSTDLINFKSYQTQSGYGGGGTYLKQLGIYVSQRTSDNSTYFSADGLNLLPQSFVTPYDAYLFKSAQLISKQIITFSNKSEGIITDSDYNEIYRFGFGIEYVFNDGNYNYLVNVQNVGKISANLKIYRFKNFEDVELYSEFSVTGYLTSISLITYISETNEYFIVFSTYNSEEGERYKLIKSSDLINWESLSINDFYDRIYGIKYTNSNYILLKGEGWYTTNNFIDFEEHSLNTGEKDTYGRDYKYRLTNFIFNGSKFYGISSTKYAVSYYVSSYIISPVLIETSDFINFKITEFPELSYKNTLGIFYSYFEKCFYMFSENKYYKFFDSDNIIKTEYMCNDKASYCIGFDLYNGNLTSKFTLQDTINVINKISEDSNMNLNLKPGENRIRLNCDSGQCVGKLTYTNKYLGV